MPCSICSHVKGLIIVVFILQVSITVTAQDSLRAVKARSFFEKGDLNGALSYQGGRVSDFGKNSDGTTNYNDPVLRWRSSLALNIGIRLFELCYLRTTWYYQLNKKINAPWIITDYTYSLERVNWDPGSFSYGYTNFAINKYSDNGKQILQSMARGSFYLRYYNTFPVNWLKKIHVDTTINLTYSITTSYAIRYWDDQAIVRGNILNGKPTLSIGLRYTFLKYIYAEGAVNYYPIKNTRIKWDPDFTYSFGYNRFAHLTIGFSYGNYSVNRFPWNEKPVKNYGFLDGNFSLLLNYRW
jgi:hypothetical protein